MKEAKDRKDLANGYKNDLKYQEAQKKYLSDREKDQDKLYAALELAQ